MKRLPIAALSTHGGRRLLCTWLLRIFLPVLGSSVMAQTPAEFTNVRRQTNGDVALTLKAPAGNLHRLEYSSDLVSWQGLLTLPGSAASQTHTDTSTTGTEARYYRTVPINDPSAISGDHLQTDDGEITFHPVNHASFVFRWKSLTVYNDPVGSASLYAGLPRANLILISHSHGDHFLASTLNSVTNTGALIIAPAAVYSSLSATLRALTIPLSNGANTNVLGLNVEAIPAYNSNHPKGTGNGYVVTLGGRRVFMSGDTGNIPEMRALSAIDVAFVCINTPFTMTLSEAVTAVRAFRPAVVYPYHYRNSDQTLTDLNSFRRQVAVDPTIEVRQRKWY